MKDFFVRYFSRDRQLNEQHCVFSATSAAKAKDGAKRLAAENGWRLVNIDPIRAEEKHLYSNAYQNHVAVT